MTEKIDVHIRSYNPCVSHYRRAHAPNRLYLPHELSIKDMHQNYLQKYPPDSVSYTTYMRRVGAINIGFVKLGEECEICERNSQRSHEDGCDGNCSLCNEKAEHKALYEEARLHYKLEGDFIREGVVARSVDLQKIVMLPRLPGFKSACFTRRLVSFHETFAPIGKYCSRLKTHSFLWHEEISGKKPKILLLCSSWR